jgi:HlyD family secretion protein
MDSRQGCWRNHESWAKPNGEEGKAGYGRSAERAEERREAQNQAVQSKRMTTGKKVWLTLGALLLGGAVFLGVEWSRRGVVTVQSGCAIREDLSSQVTASGEIRPKTFVNIGANAFGKIVKLYVKEGDRVHKGQMLAQLENVQPEADVESSRASLNAAQADYASGVATLNTNIADLQRAQADLEQKRDDWKRAEELYNDQLIARKDYDAAKNVYEAAVSGVTQAEARIAQSKAAADAYQRRIAVQKANLVHNIDVLSKTEYRAPFDGVVTNLPVREGETVVVGIQNSPGSTLMTLADTSVITAEVMVDETDIVNVKLGQPAEVTIDAVPNQKFQGVVSDIGDNALLRSTGVATSQSTGSTQEAKDFKVVVTLEGVPGKPNSGSRPGTPLPENLRPGLSATAKITTATRTGALTIPIQALTMRQRGDLDPAGDRSGVEAAENQAARAAKEEVQGVFVIRNGRAQFVPVETGIMGTSDIEVLSGLKAGDEIVTGSYKALRTLKPGGRIRIDNRASKKDESE